MTSGAPFLSTDVGNRSERDAYGSRRSSDSSTDSSWVTDFSSIGADGASVVRPNLPGNRNIGSSRTPDLGSRTSAWVNPYRSAPETGFYRPGSHAGPRNTLGAGDSEWDSTLRHPSGSGVGNGQNVTPLARGRSKNRILNTHSDDELLDDVDVGDQADKVKTKLLSVWNNVKYGWAVRMKTNFSYESPIWLLGQCYHSRLLGDSQKRADSGISSPAPADNASMEHFKQDFISRIWFTYRREFPVLSGSSLTTDCGWGCMLRSGQMMLAHAFVCHYLGRGWRWNHARKDGTDALHRMIIRWFSDHPKPGIPFSVHKLVAIGESSGKRAGDWYGPASVAYILRQALNLATPDNLLLDDVCIYVAQDCAVYIQDVVDLATASSTYHGRISLGDEAVEQSTCNLPPAMPSPDLLDTRHHVECHCNPLSSLPCYQCSSLPVGHHIEGSPNSLETMKPKKLHLADKEMKHSLSSDWLENVNYSSSHHSFPTEICRGSSGGWHSHDDVKPCPSSLPSGTLGTIIDPSPNRTERWKGVVIFVPVRLGGENLNCIYIPCVRSLLAHDNCIGIIGGRPKHSLYFVGWQDDKLIYMDPHYCQEAVDVHQSNFPLQSFHCTSPRKMSFNRMDPSCTIGFYCRTRKDFMDFTRNIKDMLVPPGQKGDYPMFVICEGRSSEAAEVGCDRSSLPVASVHRTLCPQQNRTASFDAEHDDFVFL